MHIRLRHSLRLAIPLLAAIAAFTLIAVMGAEAQAPKSTQLTPQTNRAGMVTVKVTPQALSSAAPLRFEVVLDTHSVELTQDMREIAALSDGVREYKPTAWDGSPPGGHHRKGVLVFAPVSPMPASLTLTIRDIAGVPERRFTWTVSP